MALVRKRALTGPVVVVYGGRSYGWTAEGKPTSLVKLEYRHICETLDAVLASRGMSKLVEGGADGVDKVAGQWAAAHNIAHRTYEADWRPGGRYSATAGKDRSRQMIDDACPTLGIGFPGGGGTRHTREYLRLAGIENITMQVRYALIECGACDGKGVVQEHAHGRNFTWPCSRCHGDRAVPIEVVPC